MLERTLGLRSATAMMVGIVIGSGIFASPGFVVAEVNSPGATLIVWALCGLMTACGAVSMAELSAAMPRSGGESVYLSRAFHPIVGFWYTWVTSMLAKPGGAALIALVFADYTCRLEWDCVANTTTVLPDTGGEVVCDITPEWVRKGVALGAVGASTNHARIAGMLRTLAQYYGKDPGGEILFMVRIAQGILHAGKGSITLSPFHTERSLMSPVAMSGILATLISALDLENTLLKSNHSMLYHLSLAMYPRILCTFADDEDLTPINTSVRVGQAVDVVGQAGKPKTITGFITNNTPVLLGHGDRAQLATDEYLSVTPLLEGFVILKKNPEYDN